MNSGARRKIRKLCPNTNASFEQIAFLASIYSLFIYFAAVALCSVVLRLAALSLAADLSAVFMEMKINYSRLIMHAAS